MQEDEPTEAGPIIRVAMGEGENKVKDSESGVLTVPQPMSGVDEETSPLTGEESNNDIDMEDESPPQDEALAVKRTAAIRAREKIAEWTRQLFVNV
jgi:hypothetical protein